MVVLLDAETMKSRNTPAISSRLRFFSVIMAALIFCTSLGSRYFSTWAASFSPSVIRKIALFSTPSTIVHPFLDYAGNNFGFLLGNLPGRLQALLIGWAGRRIGRFRSGFAFLGGGESPAFQGEQSIQRRFDDAEYHEQHAPGNQRVFEQFFAHLDGAGLLPERHLLGRFLAF